MSITLDKRQEKVKIILTKRNMNNIPCQVKLAIDRSGSMDRLYNSHVVQDIVERVLAIGLQVDMDGIIDVWGFHNQAKPLVEATIKNIDGYVEKEIVKKMSAGDTSYAPVMKLIVESAAPQPKGLFGMFGKKASADPALAIFITDGENDDERAAEQAIIESQSKDIYWMLIGIGNGNFSFIEKLGNKYPNCGYLPIRDIAKIDDEDLYDGILNDKFAEWVQRFKK